MGNQNKAQFLDFLEGTAKKLKIHLFAYCIMDNHYHLVLENNHEGATPLHAPPLFHFFI
jgi:hypothetical protein